MDRLTLTLRGKRLGFTLSEIQRLVDTYDSTRDSGAQLKRFLLVLAQHRQTLEQQREDLEIALAEIAAHEAQCRHMLATTDGGRSPPAKSDTRKTARKPSGTAPPAATSRKRGLRQSGAS